MPRPSMNSLHRLLVEGQDDLFAIAHLIKVRFTQGQSTIDFQGPSKNAPFIQKHDGVENLLAAGTIDGAARTYRRLGIVLDADQPPLSRWDSVRARLALSNVALPASPATGGIIVAGHRVDWKVGVWLMPDNANHGALEEFLLPLVPPGDKLWPVVEASTSTAEDDRPPLRGQRQLEGAAALLARMAGESRRGRRAGDLPARAGSAALVG